MDTLGSLKGSENPTNIVVLGYGELRNDAMINYTSASCRTLMGATSVKVEAGLPLF